MNSYAHRRKARSLALPARSHRHWLGQLAFVVMLIGLMVAIGGAQAGTLTTASPTSFSPEESSAEERSPKQ